MDTDGMFDDASDDDTLAQATELAARLSPARPAMALHSASVAPTGGETKSAPTLDAESWPTLQETVKPGVEPSTTIHRTPLLRKGSSAPATAAEPVSSVSGVANDLDEIDEEVGASSGAGCGVEVLVVDTAGFIRDCPLHQLGRTLVTLHDVMGEIRDRATRKRLDGVLPYSLTFREPSQEALRAVTDFAKKTGDYRTLSAVDLRVLALT